jgi:hypothetical protein
MNKYNKSSSTDQAKLSGIAIKMDLIKEIVGRTSYSCEIKNEKFKLSRTQVWENTN